MSNYVLILDEVLDILTDFNKVVNEQRQTVSIEDIKMLQDENLITIDQYNKVKWIGKSYVGGKFSEVERLAKRGNLLLLDNNLFVWEFPYEIFALFKEVYVLTYMFDGSYLKPFFEYHDIPYELKGVVKTDDKEYVLTPYTSDVLKRQRYKNLIHVHNDDNMNNYKDAQLSKNWFVKNCRKEKDTPAAIKLRNNLYNYFQNIQKAKVDEIMWTCPSDYYKRIKGKGFTEYTEIIRDEDGNEIKTKQKCFLPCNARASNLYQQRHVLAYCINLNANPALCHYLSGKNSEGKNISVDLDAFSASCMIQWIWRSRIRNGQPIDIYIPSTRMRNLLFKWIEGDI